MTSSIALDRALEAIVSDAQKTRDNGLADLKRALKLNQVDPSVKSTVKDKSIHSACERLFRVVSHDRSVYIGKNSVRSTSASRLSICAAALRLLVESFVSQVKGNTVGAILGHILQCLPSTIPGQFCPPLAPDYFKTLIAILEYPAHVEHLSHNDWTAVSDFSVQSLNAVVQDLQTDRSRTSEPFESARNAVDLLKCIRSLTSATNAPLFESAEKILKVVLDLIKAKSSPSSAHDAAFQTINNCLKIFSTQSSKLMLESLETLLPLIRILWPRCDLGVREQMLVSLISAKPYLISLRADEDMQGFSPIIQSLLEVLLRDYLGSRKREHLKLEDLSFYTQTRPTQTVMPMQGLSFSLRSSDKEKDHNWTLLHFMAFFINLLDSRKEIPVINGNDREERRATKRHKTSSELEDMVSLGLQTPLSDDPIAYKFQILSFVLDSRTLELQEAKLLATWLADHVGHKNTTISSWAMLCLANLSFQQTDCFIALETDFWPNIWHTAVRYTTSIHQCRAACHLLDCLLRSNNVKSATASNSLRSLLISAFANGPAFLCDTALSLWSNACAYMLGNSLSYTSVVIYRKFFEWICRCWQPSMFENKEVVNQIVRNSTVRDIADALQIILGHEICASRGNTAFSHLGQLGQEWILLLNQTPLLNYLLLIEDASKIASSETTSRFANKLSIPAHEQRELRSHIFSFFSTEFDDLETSWLEMVTNRPSAITEETVYVIVSFCILGTLICNSLISSSPEQIRNTELRISELMKNIASFVSDSADTAKVLSILEPISMFLPEVSALQDARDLRRAAVSLSALTESLATSLDVASMTTTNSSTQNAAESAGDFDREADFQPKKAIQLSRHQYAANHDLRSYIHSVLAYIHLLDCYSRSMQEHQTNDNFEIPDQFIEELKSLTPLGFASISPLLSFLFASKFYVNPEGFLEYLEAVLRPYEWNRCEVVLCACIDILIETVALWITSNTVSGEYGAGLYEYFVETALNRGILSVMTQARLSDLLYKLLQVDSSYTQSDSDPSVRTRLFQILRNGSVAVQYHVSQGLVHVFDSFPLDQHELVLNDIHDSLPNDLQHPEGLCLRVQIFSQIGIVWKNLSRLCLYYILETAGVVPAVSQHAKKCIALVAASLKLPDASRVFRLFSPQLLHTWLELQDLGNLPFSIFGYPDLRSMLQDTKGEILSQLVMIGSEAKIKDFETRIKESLRDILFDTFGQVTAYGIAKDISTNGPNGVHPHAAESQIKELLGKVLYKEYLLRDLPEIVGHWFLRLDQEEQIEKALSRKPEYGYALDALRQMKQLSSSEEALSQGQEPSFRSKSLLEELERLCRRTERNPLQIWTPTVVMRVGRMLLEDANAAFGPWHSRHTIHRLRILVCLAGDTAIRGYPLEMLLHGVRPFIANIYCAEDAAGLFQYLLESGKNHLFQSPQFFTGTCLTLMLSFRDLFSTSPENTTTAKQHRGTIAKAQIWQSWLVDFVTSSQSPIANMRYFSVFQDMMHLASELLTAEQSVVKFRQRDMLLQLLRDMDAKTRLVEAPFIVSCLQVLCKEFEEIVSFKDDKFSNDDTSANLSLQIWKSLQMTHPSESYVSWAAKSLGRSFGSKGSVDTRILRETELSETKRLQRDVKHPNYGSTSRIAIVRSIVEILWDDRANLVGLAENALIQIMHSYKDSSEIHNLEVAMKDGITDTFKSFETFPSMMPKASDLELSQEILKIHKPFYQWPTSLAKAMSSQVSDEVILTAVSPLLDEVSGLSQKIFPFLLHLFLLAVTQKQETIPEDVSRSFNHCFDNFTNESLPHLRLLINSVLYLRSQPRPQEGNKFGRNRWLSLDYYKMALAAKQCDMVKTSLLAIELHHSMSHEDFQTSLSEVNGPLGQSQREILVSVFRQLHEPDSFYGIEQDADLDSTAERLEYEGDYLQSLLFGSAKLDSILRNRETDKEETSSTITASLSSLGLNSITNIFTQNFTTAQNKTSVINAMTESAMKLRQWDVATPDDRPDNEGRVYRAFQAIQSASNVNIALLSLNSALGGIIGDLKHTAWLGPSTLSSFRSLCALTEVNDLLSSRNKNELFNTWNKLHEHDLWMENSTIEDVSKMLSSREALCGVLNSNIVIRDSLGLEARDSRSFEVEVGLHAAKTYRKLGALQDSLSTIYYLSSLIEPSKLNFNLKFDVSVKQEVADNLWKRGELGISIQTLKKMYHECDWESQTLAVGRAGLLSDIAHRVSHARLQKPDEVLDNYLRPALKKLGGTREGLEAGKVFNEYATYCHNQLENPDSIEELRRSERFKRQRTAEYRELEKALPNVKNKEEKYKVTKELDGVKKWLSIDEKEYNRLRQAQEQFLRSALEHYLRSLAACDNFDTNVIRLVAIWFAHADYEISNEPVSRYQSRVPSKKFAPLMNQLGSRLQQSETPFQQTLAEIVIRVCENHPYHGMYHIFAGSKITGGHDSQAQSRKNAATVIAQKLQKSSITSAYWRSVHRSNELYVELAKIRSEKTRQGAELLMSQFSSSKEVQDKVPALKIPPITMKIDIRDDCEYGDVPIVVQFQSQISIPGGVSAPKVVCAIASNGKRYKQLFKSGTDDLRQDAIMEQVFEQVTSLLRENKATRRRDLKIRTYKVVPLDATSGAIEFVEPTTSLMDFLERAHQRYYPKDLRWKACREKMAEAAEHSLDTRLREFEKIKARFHPVLRHFFFERFEDPDDWFERRLAYTRSTAAISILGHVLGLGDRHCQNILLDTNTGEVVHIDLGVAFEAGRILPKPETVPFRLTRDIVDGFGILKTEGVFRRCCEFTLEALRTNKSTIITLLNVLRYDPLYNWSVSPLRAKRLQDEQESRIAERKAASAATSRVMSTRNSAAAQEGVNEEAYLLNQKTREDEGGEADRALSTVEKKLATTLSVSAAVNELIQQATDDKNLAVLYAGWSPFA